MTRTAQLSVISYQLSVIRYQLGFSQRARYKKSAGEGVEGDDHAETQRMALTAQLLGISD